VGIRFQHLVAIERIVNGLHVDFVKRSILQGFMMFNFSLDELSSAKHGSEAEPNESLTTRRAAQLSYSAWLAYGQSLPGLRLHFMASCLLDVFSLLRLILILYLYVPLLPIRASEASPVA
jgi:hypothetical protein